MARSSAFHIFTSHKVGGTWRNGIHLKRAVWHNFMQYGRPRVQTERWGHYFVLTIAILPHGFAVHYYPRNVRQTRSTRP